MSSQKAKEILTQSSEVSMFYDGKSILITGAAGFLGSVLLEILLRCCPGICRIYLLLRSKKGVKPEDRKQTIFKKEIFNVLLENNPAVQDKVVVVSGDITQENLGLNRDVLLTVTQEVSIIFHCAADVSFTKPLSFMINQNVIGVNNVIELCRKLKKLEVLAYTSTAYSNSNLKSAIEEKVYKLPVTAEEAIEATRNGNEEELSRLMSICDPPFLNYYTFSKCLAENLIAEKAKDLPVCIVRPSVVVCCLKGPLPGYVETASGMGTIGLGVHKGFIRVLRVDAMKRCDHIPADTVANTHVIAAYRQVSESLPSSFIYNCTAGELAPYTWDEFKTVLLNMSVKYPSARRIQTPAVRLIKSPMKYIVFSAIEHYTTAIVIDFLLWITGSRPRMLKLYRFFDKCMTTMAPFGLNEWDFKCENFKSLIEKVNTTDLKLFPVDLRDFTIERIAEILPTGAPFYLKEKDNKSIEERKWITYLRSCFISSIKWFLLGGIASVFYVAI